MQITQAVLQSLQTSFSTLFEQGYKSTPQPVDRFCTRVSSATRLNTYGWMKRIQRMREWLGPRVVQNLDTFAYQLINKSFEATLGVPREDIEDDQLGLFDRRMSELGRIAGRLPYDLVLQAITDGITGGTGLTFDGLTFFNANHTLNSTGVQSNTGAETFSAGFGGGVDLVTRKMTSYLGEDGLPLGVRPNLFLIPPSYEFKAKEIFRAPFLAGGATNVQAGDGDYLVIPEWAGLTRWVAIDTTAGVMPFIYQDRKAPELVSKANLEDDNVFWDREFIWGVDARGAAGYGPWWLAHFSTGAAA